MPSHLEYDDAFNGTSASVPYISGIIGNMMAINPSLNPHRATTAERANIVDLIATILDDTAYKKNDGTGVLPLSGSVKVSSSVAAAMDARRNMINADKAW